VGLSLGLDDRGRAASGLDGRDLIRQSTTADGGDDRRHRVIAAWLPDRSTAGTSRPRHTSGRV